MSFSNLPFGPVFDSYKAGETRLLPLLDIENLEASVLPDNKPILKNLSLCVKENQIHVIMGPNGSGKSTFAKLLAGHPSYVVTSGTIEFSRQNLLDMDPQSRSHHGLFLAFQYPVEIPGLSNYDFLFHAYNEKLKFQDQLEVTPLEFMSTIDKTLQKLQIKPEFLQRNVNEGFSGGEKKRNEILQMLLLRPKLIILDEIDSGLDIDALKVICQGIIHNKPLDSSVIIITHYTKIVEYLRPTHVHIMLDGKIVYTGDTFLIDILEKFGYDAFTEKKEDKATY